MPRWVIGVGIAIVLVVAAWIGWPRDDGGGAVTGEFGAATESDERDPVGDGAAADPDTGGDAAPSVDPGDPALEVVTEPEFDVDEKPTGQVDATWNDDVRAAAREAATSVLTTFADAARPADQWWKDLSPLLTPQAQAVYQDVDPRTVPVRTVTGTAKVVDETSTLLTTVTVPTDIGDYTVLLVRADGGSPWLAERIRPPS